jgi:ZIP family zinc transporter
MEARGATAGLAGRRAPAWVYGLAPLLLIAAAIGLFAALGDPGLDKRSGPPVEKLAVERTVLRPGRIELTVRNDGADSVRVAQVIVNDGFTDFATDDPALGRLESTKLRIAYPWVQGETYNVDLLTSTGAKISHRIDSAVETPQADFGFFRLMALLGFYVGIVPIALGMLWLPFVRRIDQRWVRFLMAVTVGLLGFLAIDATLEGLDVAGTGSQVLGGQALVFLGAATSYLLLSGVQAWVSGRQSRGDTKTAAAGTVALLVALAIGMHNLGEGLAIGSAYAVGALSLGAFLVIGFALHNTTEGLAIVAPVASDPPPMRRLLILGALAGAPAIVGAWIGAAAFNSSVAAFLLGAGAGAVLQVIQQLIPAIRDRSGKVLHPAAVAGILGGLALLYVTSLLVNV